MCCHFILDQFWISVVFLFCIFWACSFLVLLLFLNTLLLCWNHFSGQVCPSSSSDTRLDRGKFKFPEPLAALAAKMVG